MGPHGRGRGAGRGGALVSVPRGERRLVLLLFLATLLVRLAAVAVLLKLDARPSFDEYGYDRRAQGWQAVADDLSRGAVAPEHWRQAYDRGFQPPLHPLLMSTVYTADGAGAARARALSALWSALATPLVYLIARRLADRRAATAAAWLHVIYPAFSFFGASLWAEPLYILLLLGAWERALAARDVVECEAGGRTQLRRAATAGLALGLLALTRPAGLPYLLLLPLAFLGPRRCWPGRRRATGVMVLVATLTVLPWELTLWRQEGRPVLLATGTGFNLALGNNPLIADGEGATWLGPETHARLRREVADFAAPRGRTPEAAMQAYALDQVSRDPAAALRRVVERAGLLWSADAFTVRHLVHAVVRPQPLPLIAVIWSLTFVAYLCLAGLVLRGLLIPGRLRHRRALLLLTIAGAVGPLLTVAFSRLNLPLLALLLPAAGVGWTHRAQLRSRSRRLLLGGLVAGVAAVAMVTLRPVIETQLMPSAWARPVVAPVARAVGAAPVFGDMVELIYRPAGGSRPDSLRVEPAPGTSLTVPLDAPCRWTVSVHPGVPWQRGRLGLRAIPGSMEIVVDPVRADLWWVDQDLSALGFAGLSMRWQGGAAAYDYVE